MQTHDLPYKFRFADVPYLNYSQFMSLMIVISFMTIGVASYLIIYIPINIVAVRILTKYKYDSSRNVVIRMWSHMMAYFVAFCFISVPLTVSSMFLSFSIYAAIVLQLVMWTVFLFHRHVRENYRQAVMKKEYMTINDGEDASANISLVSTAMTSNSYYRTFSTGGNRSSDKESDIDISSLSETLEKKPRVVRMLKTTFNYFKYYPLDILLGLRLHYIRAFIILLVAAILPTLLVVPTCNTCFAVRPIVFSSLITRKIDPQFGIDDKDSVCFKNHICYTYLTVPRDMSTSMIINFHSYSGKPQEAYVQLTEQGNPKALPVRYNATYFRMDTIVGQERYQFWADLTDLKPSTVYIVTGPVVIVNGKQVPHKDDRLIKFKTGPSLTSEEEISFVSGGDMEFSIAGRALSRYAATQRPLFALIGGDIAYENGIPACFMKVDYWFHNWNEIMITDDGLSIPILSIIGNHEAGGFRMKRSSVGFYIHYFPHELGLQNVKPIDRILYHEHVFANHTYIAMTDSYIITPIKGEQTEWLEKSLQSLREDQIHRYVAYHASAYPMVEHEIQDIVSQLRNHFCPLMEKYNVKIALEHHYHALAQSHRITAGKLDQKKGVRYLGSGAWGLIRKSLHKQPSYLVAQENYSHVYLHRCDSNACFIKTLAYHPLKRDTEIYSTFYV
jgi:hypothetical protein